MTFPSGLLTGGLLCASTPPLSLVFLTQGGSQSSDPTEKGRISPSISIFMEQYCCAQAHKGEAAHSALCTCRIYASVCIKPRCVTIH